MAAEPRPPLVIEPIRTERLDLTPLDPAADAAALHATFGDPLVHRYDADAQVSESVDETEERLRRQVVANGGTTWAIRLRGGHPIGTIGVFADQGTTIRGVGWSLDPAYWRRRIMSEAARAALPFLLAQDGVDGLEAWVDSANAASLGVARAAGMTERGRLPRTYGHSVGQTVVMARAAVPQDPEVLGVTPVLVVSDLAASTRLLQQLLRLHVAWAFPDPPRVAFLAVEPWSGSNGFQLQQADGLVEPAALSFDVGISVDEIRSRVVAAGLSVVEEPAERAWARRAMSFRLPDGHLISISGPMAPHQL